MQTEASHNLAVPDVMADLQTCLKPMGMSVVRLCLCARAYTSTVCKESLLFVRQIRNGRIIPNIQFPGILWEFPETKAINPRP